ncbi:MAG: hypothetical protein ACRDRK_00285 [Pseudonocardia sp.]
MTRATLRRSVRTGAVAGLLSLAVLIPAGYALFALFACVGLALGALNSFLVVQAVARFASTQPSKARFSGSVLFRLGVITVLALGCALLFRPAGLAVFGGLALFQFIAIVCSMLPLIKEIRQR